MPGFRRAIFRRLYRLLQQGLTPGVVLRGPRRVGKTVLLRQLMEQLRRDGVPPERILYVAFDELPTLAKLREPVLEIARWFEEHVLQQSFNDAARASRPAYLLLDEVQNLRTWAPQLKHLVDMHGVRVLLTGSSSLRIEAGRDSIAGRVETVTLGPLLLREIAELREGVTTNAHWVDNGAGELADIEFWRAGVAKGNAERAARSVAFAHWSDRGGYPIAQERPTCRGRKSRRTSTRR